MPQSMPNTGFGNNPNGFDIMDFLRSISKSDPNDPMQNWKGTANTAQDTPTINPSTGLHDDQASALQGVLNKYDKQQAEEAFNSKGPEAMRQLLDFHYQTAPSEQQDTNSSASPSSSTSSSATPNTQQQGNFGYQPDNPVSKFFNMLGITPTPENQLLLTQAAANRQKIAAGQPAEIAVPLAQAGEINQKIQGAVPLQPADIVKLNVDTYSAALKANQDAYANSNTELANLTKTLDILQQGRSTWGKAFGGNTDIMNSLKQVIAEKTVQNANIAKNQKKLMDNAPVVSGEKGNAGGSGFKVIGVR